MIPRVLNITNGEYFNEYFLANFGGEAVPFCEAMMDGDASLEIFSEEFVSLRSARLGVEVEEYRLKTKALDAERLYSYSQLSLWFGTDTFCQLNLLTLLAYLEQISFGGKVVLNYVDDESFDLIDKDIEVCLGLYEKLYEKILVLKQMPECTGVLSRKAVELYFDYLSNEGKLSRLIRENPEMDRTALICLLLDNSKEYGLSDLQAEKLILMNANGNGDQ